MRWEGLQDVSQRVWLQGGHAGNWKLNASVDLTLFRDSDWK